MYNTASVIDIDQAPSQNPRPNSDQRYPVASTVENGHASLPNRREGFEVEPTVDSNNTPETNYKQNFEIHAAETSNISLTNFSWMKKNPYMFYIGVFVSILTLISMIFSIISYKLLSGAVSDVGSVIDNWTTIPIYNVSVHDHTESCPSGYSSLYTSETFKGSKIGSCACEANALGYVSTYANCSATIEPTNTCASDPAVESVKLNLWRGKKLCYIREGQAAYEFDKKKQESYDYTGDAAKTPWRRPRPDSSGTCISGYQLCGAAGSYSSTKSFCYPIEYQCPLSGLKVASAATTSAILAAGYTEYLGALDDGYALYGRRGYTDELPTIYVSQALAEFSSGTAYDMLTYTSDDNKRGFCYNNKGSDQALPVYLDYSETYAEANDNNHKWFYDLPNYCLQHDRRWEIIDNNNMESHYISNFQYVISDCDNNRGSTNFYGLSDTNWVASNDPDIYHGTSISSAYAKVWDDYNIFNSAPTCTSGDNICTNVYYQTACGKYIDLAHQFNSDWDDVTYALYNQNEIYWSESCTSEDVIHSNLNELVSITAAQLAVVITGAIFGWASVILKWVDYAVVSAKNENSPAPQCCGRDCVENRGWIENLFLFCKMIPILASLIITAASYKVWVSVGSSSDCSDTTTDYTFNYLAEKLPEIYYSTAVTFAMDVVLLAIGVVSARKAHH